MGCCCCKEGGAGSWGRADCLSPPHELLTFPSLHDHRPLSPPPPLPPHCRTVRGLTLRLADKELTPAAQGRQAVGVALPLLLEKGE